MRLPKVIFLDFDGVICESCEIKNQAYYNSYIKFGPEIAQKALDYHLMHGGVSRVKLFPILHKMYLGREISKEEHEEMCKNFTSMVEENVVKAELTKGCEQFLAKYCDQILFFVSSGTPQDEMRRIVEKKHLNKYFKSVLGSPDTKETHINKVLSEYNISKEDALFIGDATTDRDAAKNTGIHFIARLSQDSILQKEKFTINDFTEIEKTLKLIFC
jgi:phosphoglycolate phosphatase-like HAD superfamily hydrolase